MPSTRPCAAFEPISPEFDLKALVESTPNFEYAVRIHSDMIEHHGLAAFERLVLMHVILGGKPLVIEGYETKLDRWIFAIQWLKDNCGSNVVDARDLTKQVNVPMSIGHYLKHMSLLTNQWTMTNYKDPERQRMYLKDIDCPSMWQERLSEHVPPVLFYLNESTGEFGGLGAVEEPAPSGSGTRRGRGIAKAGDLMSSLPKEMRAENLMCYIGHEGTYTPSHREMCASLGHNIMVEASSGGHEDGQATKPGSSIWFMTETKEREVVSEYWLSRLGHDIEVEKHFAQVNAWKNAPFKTYVIDQKPGDFILIPPLAPHQVWNRGTRTMKIAWNRTTVETLEMAMNEALFKARMVCRDEQYKNKAIIYFTLQKYSKMLQQADKLKQKNPTSKRVQKADAQVQQLQKDFRRLHILYTRILVSESFYADRVEKKVEMVPFDGNITCSYCRCNIFNRFLTCPSCVTDLPDGEQDTYDICLECYAMGRSCACISKLKWVEQFVWGDLVQKHDQWRHLIIQHQGQVTERSPKSLKHELERLGKQRTLAQICQTELLKRPWRDIRKPSTSGKADPDEEIQVDENGYEKKRVKKKSEKFMRDHGRCHVDSYWEPRWKQAQCTKCQKNYCYGILFRAYDMMPQDIMANPEWKCPACLKICNCRSCSKKSGYKKYTPKGTLLGHNTKTVADPRSVESLVDFSYSNLQWIKKADDDHEAGDTRRLQKRRREATAAMNREDQLGDNYVNDDDLDASNIEGGILRLAEQEGIPIDPALGSGFTAINSNPNANVDSNDEDEIVDNPEQIAKRFRADEDDQAQFILPDGGVVQDLQHAYEDTEAITFTYPDPIMGTQLPPAPVEGYQEAELPYQEADIPSPSKIEMVERKRKRKLDEGEKAFHLTAPSRKKAASKKRQSLVVRLAISRDKLKEIDTLATVAKSALNGVIAPAPVVSSDLQALNVYPTEDGQPAQKKQRRDADTAPPIEVDDEYAPSRSRDRRKLPLDGSPAPQATKDTDATRRTTRLHRVTYAEPDEGEEEFNEVVQPKSKLATMEGATVLDSIEVQDDASEQPSNDEEEDQEIDRPTSAKITGKRPALTTPAIHNPPPYINSHLSEPGVTYSATGSPSVSRPNTASSGASRTQISSRMEAQAEANRRAKMAIDIDDIDDIDEWSPEPIQDDIELPDVPLSQSKPLPAPVPKAQQPTQQSKPSNNHSTKISNGRGVTNGNGGSSSSSIGKNKTQHIPIGRGGPKSATAAAASAQRAQADDWAESDSDY